MEPTPQNLAPLVQDLRVQGRTVHVDFVCPRSGRHHAGRATVPSAGTAAAANRTQRAVTQSVMFSMRSAVYSTMRSAFGVGLAGRVAGNLAHAAISEATRQVGQTSRGLSRAEQEQGLLLAFASVRHAFLYDEQAQAWVDASAAAEVLGAFQQHLGLHPVQHPYDRQVLGRMLVEVASADGQISADEAGWLTEMLPPDLGSIQEVQGRPPLTAAELSTASAGPVRVTLLMLASALAMVDEQLDMGERAVLARYGQGLQLTVPDQRRAFEMSRDWILDQAFDRMASWGGHDPHARAQLYALAGRLGMNQQEAEHAEARAQRRRSR